MVEKIINGLIGFTFGLLAFWIQSHFKKEKRILRANTETFSLLSLPDALRNEVEVKFAGEIVENILVHRAYFWNAGNTTIENLEIIAELSDEQKVLFIDPDNRFTIEESESNRAVLILKFLNPSETKLVKFHTTGAKEGKIIIRGEGPGIDFKAGDRVLPVIDPNADPKELRNQILGVMFGRTKKNLVWFSLIYVAAMIVVLGIIFIIETYL